ncbi:MAG: 4-hydroxy-tetrahydrodipicolinate synthase [Oscillospiraceae bacterium]|nr:4-hydroxy-tetrahydrodipicolinate synthase [Oscillospiraceae bacterium]
MSVKKTIFTGAGVALVTPVNADLSVNYDKLRELVDWQIVNGTDAVIACGTTGEASTLTDEEHVKVIAETVKAVKGRVPVIAGTGSNDTAYALELSLEAQKAGADALLLVTPYYNKTSQTGLIKHFIYLADRVDLPVILYNVPSRTGMDIKPETYAKLAGHPNIVAVKEANGKISEAAQTALLCGDNLDLYVGNDDQITAFMALGAKGVISVLSNVIPRQTHEMAAKLLAGDTAGSRALQLRYLKLINSLFIDTNPIPVKAAMNLMGFDVGGCRMPLCEMSGGDLATLESAMKEAGIL